MVVALVGVTLVAKTSREGFQQPWVLRTVRAVAFGATFTCPTSDRVVFKSEGAGFLSVASDAHFFNAPHFLVGRLAGVDIVAVATNQTPFRDRMAEVESKLVDLPLVARAAQGQLIGFQQGFGLGGSNENLAHQLQPIASNLVLCPFFPVPVNLVAGGASCIGLGVGRPVPLR